ncbi:MAG TPA: DUF2934 domain-containing protein [Syntrophorhabdaceae bacterium]|nr:DUF2934 domain-containing protein [Syntrophorhabdaceae bacterium]HPP06316.1 DUF2934 domain-containing protein [Syntrophorhabdaceae bacterium]
MELDLREEIAKLAYEIYEREGRVHGRDLDHWLEAERIVISRYEVQWVGGEDKKSKEDAEKKIEKVKKKATGKSKKEKTAKAKKTDNTTEKKTKRTKKKTE